ncbi:phage tail tape measure protein [Acinetobacter radioresistens]|uniref:hypothetical protein n=1 Tax=Acinetobacter radioresistens TaxID=40216 RepID=UPI000DAD6262|nr:hypothetical protein [Acinetobacter radioresistens]AWV87045.1 hypothetical protein DOM24_10765 [Acinetobacter radioresistens]MCX0328919.1 hypothetical protein [Acinetobacter radioresistens]
MATSSLGRLTLDLAVKLGSFEQGMTQAERKTKDTTEKMGKAFSGFKSQVAEALGGTQIGSIVDSFNTKIGSLRGGILIAGGALAGMAAGGIAIATGGLAKMAIDAAKADAQLLVLANRANTSAENFQILQYAASGLGVTQDQLGSILADVQEKLGEFSATSGGGAADFFDALKNNTKMTEDQIKSFGKTLQGKDGVEAIQLLSDKLDELGATSQERRFVFESLASDLGNLAPIFAENGDLLEKYGDALRDAGVIKSGEALEQSKLLAAQTESVRMRFDGLKGQLASQMMPALNSLVSHFIEGATKGGQFGGIIKSVGVIARGVGVVIIGVAASIEVMIKIIGGLIDQAKNVAKTALDVWNADGMVAKAKATWNGLANAGTLAVGTFTSGASAIQTAMNGAGNILDSATAKTDKLAEANLAIAEAAKQSAAGLRINTKEADENTKAKEKAAAASAKAAKEQAKLNGLVGASALSGLRIKSSEAFAGGKVRGYTAEFAKLAQDTLGSQLNRFTAFNDSYHKGTNSKHAIGKAFDFTVKDVREANASIKRLQEVAKKYGFTINAINEYAKPSARSTGGHVHVSVLGYKGTTDMLKDAQAELSIIASTNEEAKRIQDERFKAQQAVAGRYYTELEKLEYENSEAIKEINEAFAGDESARQKYLQLQQLAYKKDVEDFKKAQQAKYDSFKRDFADRIYNSQNNLDLMGVAAKYGRDSLTYKLKELGSYTNSNKRDNNTFLADSVGRIQDEYAAPNQEKERQDLIEQAYKAHKLRLQEIDAEHNEATKALVMQQASMQIQAFSGLTGSLMGLVDQSSSAYAALYSVQKSFNLAQAIMNGYTAISAAWASAPFPYNMGAVTMATIETGVLQSAIEAVTPVGMAHSGIDSVPREGTWLLDKGERVVTSNTSAKLDKTLDRVQQAQSSNQANSPNVNLNPNFVIVDEREKLGDYLYSPDGKKAFVKFFKQNRRELGLA